MTSPRYRLDRLDIHEGYVYFNDQPLHVTRPGARIDHEAVNAIANREIERLNTRAEVHKIPFELYDRRKRW